MVANLQIPLDKTSPILCHYRTEEEVNVNGEDVEPAKTHESSHNATVPHDGQKFSRNSMSCSRRTPSKTIPQRQRLVSTSLMKTPVIDGALIDYHDHRLKDGEDPFDMKYKLYAVVVSSLNTHPRLFPRILRVIM